MIIDILIKLLKLAGDAIDAVILIGLDKKYEREMKEFAQQIGWDPEAFWAEFVEYHEGADVN